MPLTCNLDDAGARIRRVWGLMALFSAALLAGMAFWSGTWWLWIIVGAIAGAGVFALFEARSKWSALRAFQGSDAKGR